MAVDPGIGGGMILRALLLLALLAATTARAEPPAFAWSASDHGGQIATDGGFVTRRSGSGAPWQTVRSELSQSHGVRTTTFRIVEMGSGGVLAIRVGIVNGAAPVAGLAGTDANGMSYWSNGTVTVAGVNRQPLLEPFTAGDVITMVADLDAHTVRFRRNGGAASEAYDIATLGLDVYVAVSLYVDTGAAPASVRVESSDWNDFAMPTINVVGHGDSITLGAGVRKTWVQRLAEKMEENRFGRALWTKVGINGASWDYAWPDAGYPYTLIEDAPRRVDPLRVSRLPSWLVVFAGTNGVTIGFHNAAQEYAALQSYLRERVAAGWPASHIVVCTMLPRTGVDESLRAAYNAAIVGDAAGIGYRVARLDLDPNLGGAGQNLNTNWYLDGIHPSEAGHGAIAQVVFEVLRTAPRRLP